MVLTDASADSCYTGMLGFVVFDPLTDRFFVSALRVPGWAIRWLHRLRRKDTYIGQHELLEELGPYMSLPHVFYGRRAIHYVDNESALCASVSGYSSQGDSSRLVNMLHVVRLHLHCSIWFLHVPSESNMSDWPSRGRIRDVIARGARAVRMVIPSLRLLTAPWSTVFAELESLALSR